MATPFFVGPAFAVLVLALASCRPDVPAPGAVPAAVVLDPAVMALIERLDDDGQASYWNAADEASLPEPFGELVRMGPAALPTILQVLEDGGRYERQRRLMMAAVRIGDPRARAELEQLLRSRDPEISYCAVQAVGLLGLRESLPALRAVLAGLDPGAASERLDVLHAMYLAGDQQVIGEVIQIAASHPEVRWLACHVLLVHPPLRRALGYPQADVPIRFGTEPPLPGDLEVGNDELFWRAADEWYRENVLGQPSPWRPAAMECFDPPCAAAKRAALTSLLEAVARDNDDITNLRVHPVDPSIGEADSRRELRITIGYGHDQSLAFHVWQPGAGSVEWHTFLVEAVKARSAFPRDCWKAKYEVRTIPSARYLELIAGLRTILEAKLEPWWHGPSVAASGSSMDFVVSIQGLGAPEPTSFCGYRGSAVRPRYAGLLAACLWCSRFREGAGEVSQGPPTAAAKLVFSRAFRSELPLCREWWWVIDRMLGLAASFGDETLREPLAGLLAMTRKGKRVDPAAEGAATALAAITGVDLRFASDGKPRPLEDVAAAYLQLLASGSEHRPSK